MNILNEVREKYIKYVLEKAGEIGLSNFITNQLLEIDLETNLFSNEHTQKEFELFYIGYSLALKTFLGD